MQQLELFPSEVNTMKYRPFINVFDVRDSIKAYGIWYAVWYYGHTPYALWTIFVASRLAKLDRKLGLV